ncbi:uncharacterized protein LOC123692657 [Colias croceus]|uniref:uncharacterized protein LOC123692657 n=1 Tax=Colias crocea TaxID=72248 RepID=UPI001E280B06|nr:uncharacterized protein LOC123692657 [Colias croceus]
MKLFIAVPHYWQLHLAHRSTHWVDSEMVELIARRRLPALEHEELREPWSRSEAASCPLNGGYVLITEGEISFVGDDCDLYISKYSAGIDGYQVESNHPLKAPEHVQPIEVVSDSE